MKMFHRSLIVALTTRRTKHTHRNDAKTMENPHRSHHDTRNYLESTTMEKRWKFPIAYTSLHEYMKTIKACK